MTTITRLPNESLQPTTPSSPGISVGFVTTGTVGQRAAFDRLTPAPPDFVEIDAAIAAHESTPIGRDEIAAARKEMAEIFDRGDITLRKLRLAQGMSQARLAERLGTTQPHIARIESGRCDVQVTTLLRIAGALGQPAQLVIDAFVRSIEPIIGER
ncbi:MAG TPA: helix-turn-helix transcriptional regulator [Usitatibacter sp.]|nr:helix-turn-helix transcriptional regulator [Usitatibacter sp.]